MLGQRLFITQGAFIAKNVCRVYLVCWNTKKKKAWFLLSFYSKCDVLQGLSWRHGVLVYVNVSLFFFFFSNNAIECLKGNLTKDFKIWYYRPSVNSMFYAIDIRKIQTGCVRVQILPWVGCTWLMNWGNRTLTLCPPKVKEQILKGPSCCLHIIVLYIVYAAENYNICLTGSTDK